MHIETLQQVINVAIVPKRAFRTCCPGPACVYFSDLVF